MRTRLHLAAIAVVAASLFGVGSARAAFIAGWDFTQYAGASSLVVDANTFATADTLKANYSDFDATFGAGGDSQPFGTMYMNGANGSTNVDENAATPIFLPTTGSLTPNLSLPGDNETPVGDVAFDASAGVLQSAAGNYNAGTGQDFRNVLSMRALANLSVVFEANLSALGPLFQAQNWSLSFAGVSSTLTSDVTVEFSTDGISYSSLATANLTTTAAAFTRSVLLNPGDNAFFRLGFTSTGANPIPRIDNVTISGDVSAVPEPGTAMLLLLGLTGLGVAGRRRA
ncbi:MAG TPA: PEP-CTERM sorting domain-containing protein [Myxococcota bacterium]